MVMERSALDLLWRGRSPKRVKTDAYNYASEGRFSREMDKLVKINRFGLEAITGRPVFLFRDLCRLMTAERIVAAYRARAEAENWATWAQENPGAARILAELENTNHANDG
jgi:hypothetical protein